MRGRVARAYRRLPGRGRTPIGAMTLWIAEDHLLSVELRGFTESYRRLYFRDIQAIVIRRTRRSLAWGIALGLLGVVFLALAANAGEVAWIIWGGLSGLVLVGWIVNFALGPSAHCVLRTALQSVELRPLCRLRRARRVMDRLRLHIVLAQGEIPGETLQAAAGGIPDSAGIAPPAVVTAPPLPRYPAMERLMPPLHHDDGRMHEALAYALLFSAVTIVVPVFYFNLWLNAALSLIFMGRIGLLIAAIARQHRSDLPQSIKRFAWTAFALEGVLMAFGFVSGMVILFKLIDSGGDAAAPVPPSPMAIMEVFRQNPLFKTMMFLYSLTYLALGVWGLVLHRRALAPRRTPWPKPLT